MPIDVKIPEVGESISEVQIGEWRKSEGDTVEQDEIIVEIETDKASVEIPAPAAGTLSSITRQPGDVAQVGDTIAKLETESAGTSSTDEEPDQQEEEDEPSDEVKSDEKPTGETPAEQQVDDTAEDQSPRNEEVDEESQSTDDSDGNGKKGTTHETRDDDESPEKNRDVSSDAPPKKGQGSESTDDEDKRHATTEDVDTRDDAADDEEPAESQSSKTREDSHLDLEPRLMPPARRALAEHGLRADDVRGTGPGGRVLMEDVTRHMKEQQARQSTGSREARSAKETRVPISRLRRTIARRLTDIQQTAALLTTFNEIDMSAIMDLRNRYGDDFSRVHDVDLGFMSFFVWASCRALRKAPVVNAVMADDEIVYRNYYDIGIAVSTDDGLVVPIIRNADTLEFSDIERVINDCAARARDRKIEPDELTGGTFTITNGGVFGSLLSTPIVNPPQSAILGMHRIQDRPVAVEGEVVVRPMMYVALTYDHRLIDGKEAVMFLGHVKAVLEDPARSLLKL